MKTVRFRKTVDEYTRDVDSLAGYLRQATLYLSTMTGDSPEVCEAFIRDLLSKDGQYPFKDPVVHYLDRPDFEDRFPEQTTLNRYIKDSVKAEEIMAPTFTTYCHPKVRNSLLSLLTIDNIRVRDVLKAEKFAAGQRGDKITEIFKDGGQTNAKLSNNAVSGASISASTPIFNLTSHSTLTSNCRTTTAYANANNEKFVEGNRHYFNTTVILNNLVSICDLMDHDLVQKAMSDYNLAYPTVDDVISCIDRSASLYHTNPIYIQKVLPFVEKMKPLQRAAFVYSGDFWHLKKHNPGFVRQLINDLVWIPTFPHDDPDSIIKEADSDIRILATQICKTATRGSDWAVVKGAMKDAKAGNPPKDFDKLKNIYGLVAACIENFTNTLGAVQSLIDGFWMTEIVPASVAFFPYCLRRSVLGGDTDSTLFTVESWVLDHTGDLGFNDHQTAISDTIIYLAAMTTSHLLARMAANFGVPKDRLFMTEMKNEYKFDMFVTTSRAKHYYASASSQEGNVLKAPKYEFKGVGLISSNVPPFITKSAKDLMIDIMTSTIRGEKLSLKKTLNDIGDSEQNIVDTIADGGSQFFRGTNIKPLGAYKNIEEPHRTPYGSYLFWNATFGKKYGIVPPPPYAAVKVSIEAESPTELRAWLASFADQTLAEDIRRELEALNRKGISTINIPVQVLQTKGMPPEILSRINTRKIIKDSTSPLYIILESLGVFMLNDNTTRMVYDHY